MHHFKELQSCHYYVTLDKENHYYGIFLFWVFHLAIYKLFHYWIDLAIVNSSHSLKTIVKLSNMKPDDNIPLDSSILFAYKTLSSLPSLPNKPDICSLHGILVCSVLIFLPAVNINHKLQFPNPITVELVLLMLWHKAVLEKVPWLKLHSSHPAWFIVSLNTGGIVWTGHLFLFLKHVEWPTRSNQVSWEDGMTNNKKDLSVPKHLPSEDCGVLYSHEFISLITCLQELELSV